MLRNFIVLSMVATLGVAAVVAAAVDGASNIADSSRSTSSMSSATTSTTTQSATTTFAFPVHKGQYIFIGNETGTAGKANREQGIHPLWMAHMDPESNVQKWEMRITVKPAGHTAGEGDKSGKSVWDVDASWFREVDAPKATSQGARPLAIPPADSQGMRRNFSKFDKLEIPDKKCVEVVAIEMVDASNEIGIEGMKLYKIPYAKADGELQYLVVATSDKKESISRTIHVPKSFFLFSWDSWVPVN